MNVGAENIREKVHHLPDELPPDATWKDALYEAYVRQEIEAGLGEAERDEFATEGEIHSTFVKWGVQVETEVDAPHS